MQRWLPRNIFQRLAVFVYSLVFLSLVHLIKERVCTIYICSDIISFLVVFRDVPNNSGNLGSRFMGCQSILVRLNTLSGKYDPINAVAEDIGSKIWG